MATRINPQSGLMEFVKEREATGAVLDEKLRNKTPVETLQQEGPASLAVKPQPIRPTPAPFVLPEEQKGRVDQRPARDRFAQQVAQQDAARFAQVAEQQREAERVKPISEIEPDVKEFDAYENDGFGESIMRSDNFIKLFLDKLISGATVTGAYLSPAQGLPIAAGLSPVETGEASGQSINVNSTKGILFDPKGFNAGKIRGDDVTQVDPLFARVMSIMTERFIYQNQYNAKPDQQTDNTDDFTAATLRETDRVKVDEGKLRRGLGNQQLGREIFRAWKREQNIAQGRPSDEYTEKGVTGDQFETIGTLAKEMYHAANPELYNRISDSFNRTVEYELTTTGAAALEAAEKSSPAIFTGYEIKPSSAPRSKLALTESGLGEGAKYRKTKTTSVVDRKMAEIEEAAENMHGVAHGVDPLRRKLYIQIAMQVLAGMKDRSRPPELGDLLKIGPSKFIAFKGEFAKKQQDDPNPDYRPEFEMEKQITRFIESLNTIGVYSNKANHLDFAVQELQSRMHATQTRFNPQLIPWIRFVTGGIRPPTVNPNVNTGATVMFKELMAKHFLPGGDKLLPENRVAAFDTEWNSPNHGAFANIVADGKGIADSLMTPEQDQDAITKLKQIKLTEKGVTIPPELANIPRLTIGDSLKSKAIGEELEGLNLIEAAHELYQFDKAQKNNTSFKSNISVELDGKTHGPSSNLAQLGSMKAAFRSGILRKKGATKNLDGIPISELYQGAQTSDELKAGDIRDGMKYFMEENGLKHALNFISDKTVASHLHDVLKLALKDRDNFLKKPPMTLAYGQLLKNLDAAIYETVFTGPQSVAIRNIINGNSELPSILDRKIQQKMDTEGGMMVPSREDVVVEFLHDILADSIDAELDPGVVQVGQLLRANNVVAMLSDEVIKVKNAIGIDNYIGAKSSVMKDVEGNIGVVFGDTSDVKRAGNVPLYRSMPSGSAAREGKPGGWGRGRIIPAVIQGIDGAWMNRMFTGKSFAQLKRNYMLPIMDAVKTDLDGAAKVRELANKNWWDVIEEYSYVDSIMGDWTPGATERFRTKLKNIGDTNVQISMDNEYRGFFFLLHDLEKTPPVFDSVNLIKTLYDTMEHPPREQGVSVKDYEASKKNRAARAADKLLPNAAKAKGRTLNELTGNQMLRLFENIIGPNGLNLDARNRKTIKDVGEAKNKLTRAAKGSRILQIDM